MSGKRQIQWRISGADDLFYLPFFKLIYAEKVHLKALVYGQCDSTWNAIVSEVFKQDGFKDFEPTTGQSLQRQFKNRIKEFKTKYAYNDGKTNKSGFDGEFNELETILFDICTETDAEKERKDAKAEEKAAVEKNETTIITSMLSACAKKNRESSKETSNKKVKVADSITGGNQSSTTNNKPTQYIDDFMQFNEALNRSLTSFTDSTTTNINTTKRRTPD